MWKSLKFIFFVTLLFVLLDNKVYGTQYSTIINIDGDPGDWIGIAPSLNDVENDSICAPNADIKNVYTAIDDNYAYVMVETYGKPINSQATVEVNFDYKDGQHSLHSLTCDLHTNISGTSLSSSTDNDLDGNLESYPINEYEIAWGDVVELKLPLSELENTDYFDATFVNIWDYDVISGSESEGCDPSYVFPPAPSQQADFSEGWTGYVDDGDITFSPNESTMTISNLGPSANEWSWGHYGKSFSNAIGILATFNVSSTGSNSDNDVAVGIRKNIGYVSNGNTIQVELNVSEYNQSKRISYRVRERLPGGTTVKDYARGNLGNVNTWEINQEVTIGFAAVGGTIAFYATGTDGYFIFKMIDPIQLDYTTSVDFITWASDNGPDQIIATASDVYILTSNNLRELTAAGFIDGDSNLDGKVGLEDIISGLKFLTGN